MYFTYNRMWNLLLRTIRGQPIRLVLGANMFIWLEKCYDPIQKNIFTRLALAQLRPRKCDLKLKKIYLVFHVTAIGKVQLDRQRYCT